MEDRKEEAVPLMTRLPRNLHAAVKKFSQGNGKRPKASLNDTIIFLLGQGLKAEGVPLEESDKGNRRAVRVAA
jgi:hypothetical protein